MVDVSCTTKLKQPIAPGGATCYGFDSDLDDGVCYQVSAVYEVEDLCSLRLWSV